MYDKDSPFPIVDSHGRLQSEQAAGFLRIRLPESAE